MLRVKKKADQIIIRELPFSNWIGSFLFTVFLCLNISLCAIDRESFFQIIWIISLSVLLGASVIYLLFFPTIIIKIDRRAKILAVQKSSLIKHKFAAYSFNEIAGSIFVKVSPESGHSQNYQMILPLKTGKTIELSTIIRHHEGQYFEVADLMNRYIYD